MVDKVFPALVMPITGTPGIFKQCLPIESFILTVIVLTGELYECLYYVFLIKCVQPDAPVSILKFHVGFLVSLSV